MQLRSERLWGGAAPERARMRSSGTCSGTARNQVAGQMGRAWNQIRRGASCSHGNSRINERKGEGVKRAGGRGEERRGEERRGEERRGEERRGQKRTKKEKIANSCSGTYEACKQGCPVCQGSPKNKTVGVRLVQPLCLACDPLKDMRRDLKHCNIG